VIDLREEQLEMLLIRCVPILNLFQMKLMKVNCKIKNTLNKELEHDEELIDLREEQSENAFGSMRVNSQSVSNEIDESELQDEKQCEQRI
jgi:hypothetical protein